MLILVIFSTVPPPPPFKYSEATKSTKCSLFSTSKRLSVNRKRLTSLNLSGTYMEECGTRPPSCTHLDNRLKTIKTI